MGLYVVSDINEFRAPICTTTHFDSKTRPKCATIYAKMRTSKIVQSLFPAWIKYICICIVIICHNNDELYMLKL